MRHGDEQEREMAAVALSAAGRVAVDALRETLADPDPWLRATAADIAGDLGRESLALSTRHRTRYRRRRCLGAAQCATGTGAVGPGSTWCGGVE